MFRTMLFDVWQPGDPRPVHRRLAEVLAAIGPPGTPSLAGLAADTLGVRNRRLLGLHRQLVGGAIEARVTCGSCGVASEFVVPATAIAALPEAPADVRATIRVGGRRMTFRLPTMADLDAVADAGGPTEIRRALLDLCRIDGRPGTVIPDLAARRLAAQFERLDPAANIEIAVSCSGCAAPMAATVDVATFVARDLDRLVEGAFRDVDTIARAYGWDENRILALPDARRRRYVDLIVSAGASPRSHAVGAGR